MHESCSCRAKSNLSGQMAQWESKMAPIAHHLDQPRNPRRILLSNQSRDFVAQFFNLTMIFHSNHVEVGKIRPCSALTALRRRLFSSHCTCIQPAFREVDLHESCSEMRNRQHEGWQTSTARQVSTRPSCDCEMRLHGACSMTTELLSPPSPAPLDPMSWSGCLVFMRSPGPPRIHATHQW